MNSAAHHYPWLKAFLLLVPALALAGAAAGVGAQMAVTAGMAGGALALGALSIFVLQPKVEESLLAPPPAEAALEGFLMRMGDVESVDDVASELVLAIKAVCGEGADAALVAPEAGGGIRLISPNPALWGVDIGDPSGAFLWLGDSLDPLWRQQVQGLEDTGAIETAQLMDAIGAQVLLPLRHRGLLLGIVLISCGGNQSLITPQFLTALRIYATASVANSFLDAEAKGRIGVTETLGLANAIQESLMPEERPVRRPHWELRGLFRPVADCGGDLWLWRELPNNQLLMVIADATGHGAGPALLSAVAKGTIDAHAMVAGEHLDPGELLSALNHAIYRVGRRHFMMTAFAVVVDIPRRHIRFANAAQNFPFLIREGRLEALVVRGNSLGARESASFETHERPIQPGDKLLLFTDGIVEAGEPEAEGFGERRFRRLIQELSGEAASNIPLTVLDEVNRFLEGTTIHDDVTMVAWEYSDEGYWE